MLKRLSILLAGILLAISCETTYADTHVATSCNNGSTLGDELAPALDGANWTEGELWSIAGGVITKTVGTGGGLVSVTSDTALDAGSTYYVSITSSGVTANTVYVYFGGSYQKYLTAGDAQTTTFIATASGTEGLKFTTYRIYGCTITAVSIKKYTDMHVSDAIAAASDGDTVSVPAGVCTWVKSVTLSGALVFQGAGSGEDGTWIKGGAISGAGKISVAAVDGKTVEITGFRFGDGTTSYPAYIEVGTSGDACVSSQCDDVFSIHDNVFVGKSANGPEIHVYTRANGVIWRNTFQGAATWTLVRVAQGVNYHGGSQIWGEATGFGGEDFVFFEGNTVNIDAWGSGSATVDARSGGRYVSRYNDVKNHIFGHHDAAVGGQRGTRAFEVYNNKFSAPLGIQNFTNARGGAAVIHGNRFMAKTFTFAPMWLSAYRRTDAKACVSGCSPWDSYCDTTVEKFCLNGPTSCTGEGDGDCAAGAGPCVAVDATDGNPCRDQIGAGVDNTTTGVQASESAFVWDNWYCTGSDTCHETPGALTEITTFAKVVQTESRTTIIEDADLIVCDDDNDGVGEACEGRVKPGYAAYTCPHPLTGLTGTCDDSLFGVNGYNRAPGVDEYTLTVTIVGNGNIYSDSPDFTCPSSPCSSDFTEDTPITLRPVADDCYSFSAWSGTDGAACGSDATCTVTMSAARAVTATFTPHGCLTAGSGGTATLGSGGTITLQ